MSWIIHYSCYCNFEKVSTWFLRVWPKSLECRENAYVFLWMRRSKSRTIFESLTIPADYHAPMEHPITPAGMELKLDWWSDNAVFCRLFLFPSSLVKCCSIESLKLRVRPLRDESLGSWSFGLVMGVRSIYGFGVVTRGPANIPIELPHPHGIV